MHECAYNKVNESCTVWRLLSQAQSDWNLSGDLLHGWWIFYSSFSRCSLQRRGSTMVSGARVLVWELGTGWILLKVSCFSGLKRVFDFWTKSVSPSFRNRLGKCVCQRHSMWSFTKLFHQLELLNRSFMIPPKDAQQIKKGWICRHSF